MRRKIDNKGLHLFDTIIIDRKAKEEKEQQNKTVHLTSLEITSGGNDHNYLIHGDCITSCNWMRENNIKANLVYIDPPFASGANYSRKVYFRGLKKPQKAFEENVYGDIWDISEYLTWLYENLKAIKSILTQDGSIYLHLDWHISHYAKVIMDEIFGSDNFMNEIIWSYKSGGASKNSFAKKHDTIYFYAMDKKNMCFNTLKEKSYNRGLKPYRFKGVKEYQDEKGWYTLVNMKDVWDIDMVGRTSGERLDYSTQKPEELLERIIKASSNPGMLVADFFGGSGVTAAVAKKNNRHFIHCDIGMNSIQVTRDRLINNYANFQIIQTEEAKLVPNPFTTFTRLIESIPDIKKEIRGRYPWYYYRIDQSTKKHIPLFFPEEFQHHQCIFQINQLDNIISACKNTKGKSIDSIIIYYIKEEEKQKIEQWINENMSCGITIKCRNVSILLDKQKENLIKYQILNRSHGYDIQIIQVKSAIIETAVKKYLEKASKESNFITSKAHLEYIDMVSVNCTTAQGEWISDGELHINKNGKIKYYGDIWLNELSKDEVWNGEFRVLKCPLRIKVRTIIGTEIIGKL